MRVVFFLTHPSTTKFYTLSLHDALPILRRAQALAGADAAARAPCRQGRSHPIRNHRQVDAPVAATPILIPNRSEEHTSELQSRSDLVCRLLLEKKKKHIGLFIAGAQPTR